jgi:hypothetical protein
MLNTRTAKEVIVRMTNDIGALDRMAKTLSEKGIDLHAACAWVEGAQLVIRFVTENSVRVLDALREHKYEARSADVLVADVPHKPGMLHHVTARLAQGGIDIHHLYATATVTQEHCLFVFATANNDRALVLLNESGGA